MKFIAGLARLGYSEDEIRVMYDHALRSNWLSGDVRKAVTKADRWYCEEHHLWCKNWQDGADECRDVNGNASRESGT